MTQIMFDVDRTRDIVVLSIDPAVMKVYTAHAKTMGLTVDELLEGLLADWPAILAPDVHLDDVTPLIPAISSQRVWFVSDDKLERDDDVKFVGGW